MDQALSPEFIRRRQRIRAAIGILLLVCAVLACWALNRALRPSVPESSIVVSTVRRGDVANTINAAGVVIPVHEEVVASPGILAMRIDLEQKHKQLNSCSPPSSAPSRAARGSG